MEKSETNCEDEWMFVTFDHDHDVGDEELTHKLCDTIDFANTRHEYNYSNNLSKNQANEIINNIIKYHRIVKKYCHSIGFNTTSNKLSKQRMGLHHIDLGNGLQFISLLIFSYSQNEWDIIESENSKKMDQITRHIAITNCTKTIVIKIPIKIASSANRIICQSYGTALRALGI